jgi:hypothetical protein
MPMRRPLATHANCDEGDADNQEGVSKVANVSDLEWLTLTEKPKNHPRNTREFTNQKLSGISCRFVDRLFTELAHNAPEQLLGQGNRH